MQLNYRVVSLVLMCWAVNDAFALNSDVFVNDEFVCSGLTRMEKNETGFRVWCDENPSEIQATNATSENNDDAHDNSDKHAENPTHNNPDTITADASNSAGIFKNAVVDQSAIATTILPACMNGENSETSDCEQEGSMGVGQTIKIRYRATFSGGLTGTFQLADESLGVVALYLLKEGEKGSDVSPQCKMLPNRDGVRGNLNVVLQYIVDQFPEYADDHCILKPGEPFMLAVRGIRGTVIRPWIIKPLIVQ